MTNQNTQKLDELLQQLVYTVGALTLCLSDLREEGLDEEEVVQYNDDIAYLETEQQKTLASIKSLFESQPA